MEYASDLLKLQLQKEVPILRMEIQALYRELDRKYRLRAAEVPVTFGFEEDALGSYTRGSQDKTECFHFSLLFVGRSVKNPLGKEDRRDLYLHEYAHYMQYHMEIPEEYRFNHGVHGSAWRYCCSLVGAAPTPYYRVGEGLMKHDYKKALKNPMKDPAAGVKFIRKREEEDRNKKDRVVQYQIGEEVEHPKFGKGTVLEAQQMEGSVRLRIRFGQEVKAIDQKWLLRTQYKKR